MFISQQKKLHDKSCFLNLLNYGITMITIFLACCGKITIIDHVLDIADFVSGDEYVSLPCSKIGMKDFLSSCMTDKAILQIESMPNVQI